MDKFITVTRLNATGGGVQKTQLKLRASSIISIENNGSSSHISLSNAKEFKVDHTSQEVIELIEKSSKA